MCRKFGYFVTNCLQANLMGKKAEDLIEVIARAAINPEGWRDVLRRLVELLPGTKILLAADDAQLTRNLGLIYSGFSEWSMRAYADHFSKVNPWTPCLAGLPTMLAEVSDTVMPSASFSGLRVLR